MKYEDIQTFLTIVDSGSIAKGAKLLYITQGTASMRIKQLENELNTKLIERKKGIRQIELTPSGTAFLPIASQWLALYQDAMHLQHLPSHQELKIAAPDTLNLMTFASYYEDFTLNHPNISLTIKTHHSSEIYKLIDQQLCDIGFCTNTYPYPNISYQPLFEEEMVLLLHQDHPYTKSQNKNDLKPEDEIRISPSIEFNSWHDHYFGENNHPLITVGTILMQCHYLTKINRWTILPSSIAKSWIDEHQDYYYYMLDQAPKRTIYLLTYHYPRPGIKEATQEFIQGLISTLKENSSIKVIE